MEPRDATVGRVLADAARRRGEHPFVICDDQRISYAEAERRSAAVARGLLASGVRKGTHVGVLFPNGPDFVVAALAAARIGAVVVPFSTFVTARELLHQAVHADVAVLVSACEFRGHDYPARIREALGVTDLTERLFVPSAPVLRHVVLDLDALAERGADVGTARLTTAESLVRACDPLAIVYTSGSTADPKGTVHTHFGLLAHQADLNAIRGLTADDKLFCNSPFFWVGGFAFALLATLLAGSTLLCSNAADAGAVLDLLEAEKPNLTNGFVGTVAQLTRHPSFPQRDLSALRRGNLYPIMAPDCRPADPELRHGMLGMTEAGSVVLCDPDTGDQPESRRGSFGRPAPGFDVRVEPDGELLIRGPYLMEHYHGLSREESFDADGWFHTGDLVRTDADGYFYFLGRAGAMIKTAGANVAPPEVEAALREVLSHLDDLSVHVVGLPDPERGQIVAAVVATSRGAEVDETAVRTALRERLSSYKIPRRFVVCPPDRIPLRTSGKVDLPALVRLFDD
jgi:acyl-CoA synthetase (AMP-forming)/AMP-acid ligase II